MTTNIGPRQSRRLYALLRLGRLDVVVHPDFPRVFEGTYFTPLGWRRVICGALEEHEEIDDINGRALATSLASIESCGVLDRVLFVSNDRPVNQSESPGLRIESLDELARNVIDATQYRGIYASEFLRRMDHEESLLPLTAEVVLSGGDSSGNVDAFAALTEFVDSLTERFCCVVGSFGTGKSVLLHRLVNESISENRSPVSRYFPLLVDVGGSGHQGIRAAIERRLSDFFGSKAPTLQELRDLLGSGMPLLLILDSLDEQPELDPKAILGLIRELVSFAHSGIKTVVAFRPEIFESYIDQQNLVFRPLEEHGVNYRMIQLGLLSGEAVRARITTQLADHGLCLAAEVLELAMELAKRPLWLRSILRYPRVALLHRNTDLISLLEHCISEWSSRELRTSRPLLERYQRDLLMTVLTICIHTGQGIHLDRPGKVHRSELVDFIRRLIPRLQEAEPDVRLYMRWIQLPPELAAESIAVASLLTIDSDGFLSFSDSIFFHFYLASGLYSVLRGDNTQAFNEPAILETLGLQSIRDLLGMAPLSRDSKFITLLQQLIDHRPFSGGVIHAVQRQLLQPLRPLDEENDAPSWTSLLVRHDESEPEEAHSYEFAVPTNWPRLGSWYAPFNAAVLLQSSEKRRRIENIDLSFLDFAGCDLSGMEFHSCKMIGCDLSYCKLENVVFNDCDLTFSLFHATPQQCGIKLFSTETEKIVILPYGRDRSAYLRETQCLLDGFKDPNEIWIIPKEPISAPENQGFPVRVPPFLVEVAPVTNEQFLEFVHDNPSFGAEEHGKAIENPYYLAYLRRISEHEGGERLPIVYVSLIAAAGYAISIGKRLPSLAEYYAYRDVLGSRKQMVEASEYWGLPKVTPGQTYGTGNITEWTYQIDDDEYWQMLSVRGSALGGARFCSLPLYRATELRRCEYLVAGTSYLPKPVDRKNSKPATWINPDQGFRCVMDFRSAIRRKITREQRASIATTTLKTN